MIGTPCLPVSQPRVSFRDGLPLQVRTCVNRFPISFFFGGVLSFCFLLASPAVAQQNLISKSCTNCGREVPLSSSVGDYCPHCRVRWGGTTEKTTPGQPQSFGRQAVQRPEIEIEYLILGFLCIGAFLLIVCACLIQGYLWARRRGYFQGF